MGVTIAARLGHIADAIDDINRLLGGKTIEALSSDRMARAAFERFIEIISEASRYIPDDMKAEHATIPWREVAAMGNRLRHAYEQIEPTILWEIYTEDLAPLARAIGEMQAGLGEQR